VSAEQRENHEAIPGVVSLPVGSDISEQRGRLQDLASAQPLAAC
jgi:hypothetical protein